jgi:hypothetical protein
MSQLSVSIPAHQLAELEALGSGEQMRRALFNAYKNTSRKIRVAIQKTVKSRSSLPAKRIREALTNDVDAPMTIRQRGRVTVRDMPVPLKDYKPKWSRGSGVTAKLPLGNITFRRAFIMRVGNVEMVVSRSRQVKGIEALPSKGPNYWKTRYIDHDGARTQWRKGKGLTPRGYAQRLTVYKIYGSSVLGTLVDKSGEGVGKEILRKAGEEVMQNAQQIFEKELASQIVYRSGLSRGNATSTGES